MITPPLHPPSTEVDLGWTSSRDIGHDKFTYPSFLSDFSVSGDGSVPLGERKTRLDSRKGWVLFRFVANYPNFEFFFRTSLISGLERGLGEDLLSCVSLRVQTKVATKILKVNPMSPSILLSLKVREVPLRPDID